jgi:hypothetical protein
MSETEVTTEGTETEVKADEAEAKKSKKHPLPEGYVTPSGLANLLRDRNIADLKPQQIYGYVYHGKEFPSKNHTDGRYMVPVEDGTDEFEVGAVTWIQNQLAKKAERDAKKAAKAAAEVESTPEVGGEAAGDEEVEDF